MDEWKFNVWRLPIYIYPLILVLIEWGLRSLTNIDAQVFIGPTLAVAGATIILPLIPSRSVSAEKLLKDPNVYDKYVKLNQLAGELQDQGIISANFARPKEWAFIGLCVVSLLALTWCWFQSVYLELTSTHTNFLQNVITSCVLGFVSFVSGIALSEARERI